MPGDNCAIPDCSTSRATPGVLVCPYLVCQKTIASMMWIGEKT